MIHDLQRLATAAAELADRLPHSVLVGLASAVAHYGPLGWPTARQAILESLPTPEFRDATSGFLEAVGLDASRVAPQAIAAALLTAARSELTHRRDQTTEIVWTGPEIAGSRFRQTEQAVLEVIYAATRRLTVVSYAVYRIPRIREALVAAARRGVGICLIVETPNRIEGQNEYDSLRALGREVASASSVYYWPQEHRSTDDQGRTGLLHVKCAVADGQRLFLSSANLTEYAFTINMELGLLVTGGTLPVQVEQHFQNLISACILMRI